jgi:DNA adenine methylase
MFSADDFGRMAEVLAGIRGRFLLSINDRPEIREAFGGLKVQKVSITYSVNGGKGVPARELIISQ